MANFERFTTTPTDAKNLINLSRQLSTGKFYMNEEGGQTLPIEYVGAPDSDWARQVDAVESNFAPDYDREEYQNPALQVLNLAELEMLSRALGVTPPWEKPTNGYPSTRTVLDVGCGTGRIALLAAANGQAVTAFDQTAEYVQIAADKLSQVPVAVEPKLFVSPVEQMVDDDAQYDTITAMFAVLNHSERWQDVLRKIPSKLKDGGKLGISMYGSPDAAVFKAVTEGLSYQPGILVKRVAGGLLLGESADDVLPAAFPYPREVQARIEDGGANILEMTPMLFVTSLFPREPNSDNIASYLKAIRNIYGSNISKYLEEFRGNADQLLVASLCADYMVGSDRIDEAAYYGIVAGKEG